MWFRIESDYSISAGDLGRLNNVQWRYRHRGTPKMLELSWAIRCPSELGRALLVGRIARIAFRDELS